MANSSEWIGQIAEAETSQPSWIAALQGREGFQPGSPFAENQAVQANDRASNEVSQERPPVDAIAQAFADGEAAGRSAAKAEAQIELDRQRELRLTFRAFDQSALDSLAAELADTVVALCSQVIDACAIDREDLIARCEAAAARIGGAAAESILRLHPDDIALLGGDALTGFLIEPDPSCRRGSLLLEGPDGAVRDGPAEWRRAIADAVRG